MSKPFPILRHLTGDPPLPGARTFLGSGMIQPRKPPGGGHSQQVLRMLAAQILTRPPQQCSARRAELGVAEMTARLRWTCSLLNLALQFLQAPINEQSARKLSAKPKPIQPLRIDLLGPAAWRAGRADHAPRQAGLRMEATPGCPVPNRRRR
jgi:hypothetical protein